MKSPPPTSPETNDLTRGTLRGIPFRIVRAILLAILVPVLRLKIEGLEHVPQTGAVLLVGNHLHNADPVLVSVAFPRPLHFMAKKELFPIPVIGPIIRRVGAFPVDRGKADRGAIRHAEAALSQGIPVGIFPEGTRSPTRSLNRALPGASLLARRSAVPILPVIIIGSERLPFNGSKSHRGPGARVRPIPRSVLVRFGPPFHLPAEINNRKPSAESATDFIMTRIAMMLPIEYRGIYADAAAEASPPTSTTDSTNLPGGGNAPPLSPTTPGTEAE